MANVLQRGYDGARRHMVASIVATVVGIITGTVMPYAMQCHADKLQAIRDQAFADQVKDAEARLSKQRDDDRADRKDKDKAVWDAIRTLQLTKRDK